MQLLQLKQNNNNNIKKCWKMVVLGGVHGRRLSRGVGGEWRKWGDETAEVVPHSSESKPL